MHTIGCVSVCCARGTLSWATTFSLNFSNKCEFVRVAVAVKHQCFHYGIHVKCQTIIVIIIIMGHYMYSCRVHTMRLLFYYTLSCLVIRLMQSNANRAYFY